MVLALGATLLLALVLLGDLLVSDERERFRRVWRALSLAPGRSTGVPGALGDPGRERRAELRARALLRSCVNDEEWAMYRELGFLRVKGAAGCAQGQALPRRDAPATPDAGVQAAAGTSRTQYAYLIYPHKPIVAYLPQSGTLLGEYCITFEAPAGREGHSRLPDADDVLAKWMLLHADELGLLE
ncbi:MAG: hypothetical protein ACYDA6_06585, partial [Solirubrobacteraceae bacterium]